MNQLLTTTLIGALLSTSAATIAAETQNPDTIVVTATRTAESLASLPYTVQVLEAEQLQEQMTAGIDLGGILGQLVPGLAPGDQSVTSFYQTLRGRQVLVLIDGVAQRANRNISRQLTTIAPANIERIEVISGATAIYGAGATGGVINIITKKGSGEDITFSSSIALTSSTEDTSSDNLTYSLSQTANGKLGDFDFHAGAVYETRGTYIDADGDQIANDPNQVSRNESDTLDLLFNGGYDFNDQQRLDVSLEYFNEEMDSEYAADFGDPSAESFGLPQGLLASGGAYDPEPRKGLDLDEQPSSERQSITFTFSDSDFFGQQFLTQLNYRKGESIFYPFPGSPLALNTDWQSVAAAVTPAQLLIWQNEAIAAGATTPEAINNFIFGQVGLTIFGNSAPSASITQSTIKTEVVDIKAALTSELELANMPLSLTYGIDIIRDNGEQTATEYSYQDWITSGQTQYNRTGNQFDAGPKAQTDTEALFLQASFNPTDRLTLRAGIRREWVTTEVDDFLSGDDAINANIYQSELDDPFLQGVATGLGFTAEQFLETVTNTLAAQAGIDDFLTYSDTAEIREGGSESYNATLLNAGAIYQILDGQEVYINYGEGFTTPDMTRLLRSISVLSGVEPGPILEGTNVDAVTTESWDLGWRGQFDGISTQVSIFYNESDKNIQFDSLTGVVTIVDQEEQVWGFEGLLEAQVNDQINTGASYSYTTGQTRDRETGEWLALPADRISPQKFTAHIGYQQQGNFDVRLQLLHLADYLEASDDNNGVAFQGFTTADLLSNVKVGNGHVSLAIRNLTNEEYLSLYNQVRGGVAGGASAFLPAQGRTVSLGYSLNY